MTDIELIELKNQLNEIKEAIDNKNKEDTALWQKYADIRHKIQDEEIERNTQSNLDKYVSIAKDVLINHTNHTRAKKTVWIVEIDGKRYSSDKSKSTWTSYAKARQAIEYYLYYHINGTNQINVSVILDKLIEENFVSIKQVF